MAIRGVFRRLAAVRVTPIRIALWSVQVGLLSVLGLSLTLSSFGLLFDLRFAQALTGLSVGTGLLGLALAHEASHRARRQMSREATRFARYGAWLSFSGAIVSAGYLGLILPSLFVLALAWPIVALALVLFLANHSDARRSEAAFLSLYDPAENSSACTRCGSRTFVQRGRWIGRQWLCPRCQPAFGGVVS